MEGQLWVDRRTAGYETSSFRRGYARDHYTGDVVDKVYPVEKRVHTTIKDTRTGVRIYDSRQRSDYLHQRSQGEADGAFEERAKISRYPNHMATLVDSYVGGVFAVEDKIRRTWGSGLGRPDESGSIAHALWRDIDGTGVNWLTRLIQKSADLIVDSEVWYYVDRAQGRTRIFDIDPDNVLQVLEEDGRIVEVLVREVVVDQATLKAVPETHVQYIHYELDGWTKYREVVGSDSKRALVVVASQGWKYPFWDSADKVYRRLPIGRVRVPVRRPLGYQMARDANALYNMLSDARWLYRVLNYPRLAGDVDDDQWDKTLEAIREGMNALQGKWNYISPPHENAASVYEDYRHEVREFYISNHQRMNQSAIERSATEILYNEAAGRTAFLALFSQTIDEMENDWLSLVAQLEFPENPDIWRETMVERSRDFKPIDADLMGDRMANRFATYANVFPAPLALELAGAKDEVIDRVRTFDPAPEEDFFEDEGSSIAEGQGEEPVLG